MSQPLLSTQELKISYENIERETLLFWGKWKKVSKETITQRLALEQHRWKMYAQFLAAIGNFAQDDQAVLYYPGAGLDFNSLFVTGLREGVFIDPLYFRPRATGFPYNELAELMRSYAVRSVHISRPRRWMLRVRFNAARKNYQLWILQGVNGDIHKVKQCIATTPVVYLAKGTAQRSILNPPPAIAHLNTKAYALDFFPEITSATLHSYSGRLFHQRRNKRHLYVFQKYDFGKDVQTSQYPVNYLAVSAHFRHTK